MQVTKESELTAAILNYAMRCVIEGDQLALRQMNIGEREVDAIGKLSLLDLQRLESLKTHCLNISLNSQVFWPIIDHVQRIREEDHMIRSLLAADAPFEMMSSLYGMSSREFTARRKGLLKKTNVGRSSLPSSEEEMVLYQLWLDMDRDLKLENMRGKHYLKLFRETKLPLRSIWYLTQRWRDYPQNSAK
ncbi:MAG: STY4526/YPO1902 family pathogenicity island replication protein [Gammaproteobacteria bacterium]|nr:STY4526/YPO1902 family pathogenicity island replication protein [Gammaproteobacteria bacterium]